MRRKAEKLRSGIAVARSTYAQNQKEILVSIDTFEKNIPLLPNEVEKVRSAQFDAVGFELLKMKLQQNPRFIVK